MIYPAKVVFVDLFGIARTIAKEQSFDLDECEVWDLFWDMQEYGTDCYVTLPCTPRYLEYDQEYLHIAEEDGDEETITLCKWRCLIRQYIVDNLPEGFDSVLVQISY